MTTSTAMAPGAPTHRDEVSLRRLRGAPDDLDVEVRDEEVIVHGHRVRYLLAGDSGPVILLLHGLAGDAHTYMPILPTLAKTCRVIAPDLLGHGLSAKPRGDYSTAAFAAGMRDLTSMLGYDRVTVVGHSLGGGVAMQFAYLFPEHTERLVLISSGGLGRRVSPLLRLVTLPGASTVIPIGANRFVAPLVEGSVNKILKLGLPLPQLVREVASGWVRMSETPASRAFVTTVRTSIDLWGQRTTARDRLYLARLMPTLVIVGDKDTVIPTEHSLRAAAEAGARLELIRGVGHVPFWDAPDRVANSMLDFIAATEPAEVDAQKVRNVLRDKAGLPPHPEPA
jgi:pimeloyl-ACP methyl ester carboxylesterase